MSEDLEEARPRLTSAAGWGDFFDSLERDARAHDALGFSLGVVDGGRVHTYNHGFLQRTSAVYSSIALTAELPGPDVLRTLTPQFFSDRAAAQERYPMTAAINEGSPYGAAACLPLKSDGGALGYLALHYVGDRSFADGERQALHHLSANISHSLSGLLLRAHRDGTTDVAAMTRDQLRHELSGLRLAMRSRAEIEQAKGLLMERYSLDSDHAWGMLLRWSSESRPDRRDSARGTIRE